MFRSLIGVPVRARAALGKIQLPTRVMKRSSHDDGFPQPFDNMPFSCNNRYLLTAVFCVLFGSGFWAPMLILWYSMAKRTL